MRGGTRSQDHLRQAGLDQTPTTGLNDNRRDQGSRKDSSEDAIADLLEQEVGRASTSGDMRLDIGHRDGREEQRNTDPIV